MQQAIRSWAHSTADTHAFSIMGRGKGQIAASRALPYPGGLFWRWHLWGLEGLPPAFAFTDCTPFSLQPTTSWDMVSSGWNLTGIKNTKESHPLPECATAESTWYAWQTRNGVGEIRHQLRTSGVLTLDVGNCWETGTVWIILNGIEMGSIAPDVHSVTLRFVVRVNDLLQVKTSGALLLNSLELQCKGMSMDMMHCMYQRWSVWLETVHLVI